MKLVIEEDNNDNIGDNKITTIIVVTQSIYRK